MAVMRIVTDNFNFLRGTQGRMQLSCLCGGGGLLEPLVDHGGPLAMMKLVRQMRGQWARGNIVDKDLLSSSSCTLTPDKL